MPGIWLKQCLWVTISLPWTVVGQHLGAGGLPGQRTPRTGAVWPPYESAGQGYWARQAGFSLPFEQQGTQQQTYHHQPAQGMGQVRENQQQFYATHMVNGQAYWVPRQQQQHTYTTEHHQQQLPVIAFTQAVELTADQLRAQQRSLMHKYLISTGNDVLTSTVHPTIWMGATGQNLYRFSIVDGALTQVELLQAAVVP